MRFRTKKRGSFHTEIRGLQKEAKEEGEPAPVASSEPRDQTDAKEVQMFLTDQAVHLKVECW